MTKLVGVTIKAVLLGSTHCYKRSESTKLSMAATEGAMGEIKWTCPITSVYNHFCKSSRFVELFLGGMGVYLKALIFKI